MSATMLLDLDGTIVDSVPDLTAALNRVMAARGFAPFSRAETARMVGDGVRRLIERAFAARGAVADEAALEAYNAGYGAAYAVCTRLYPGTARTLRGLRAQGWRLAVCTNKLEAPARALLAAMGIADLFSAVGGGDSFPARKPDPAHLLATLAATGGQPGRAVMVGDHRNDVAAAHAAGLPCIFAAWGYGTPEMRCGAEAVAATFADVPPIARRLIG